MKRKGHYGTIVYVLHVTFSFLMPIPSTIRTFNLNIFSQENLHNQNIIYFLMNKFATILNINLNKMQENYFCFLFFAKHREGHFWHYHFAFFFFFFAFNNQSPHVSEAGSSNPEPWGFNSEWTLSNCCNSTPPV